MTALQQTPSANRLHIGVFGKTNSGKSSFINAFVGQEVSIVSDVPGTTTDPVKKSMEIHPLGACLIMDTAGFDDETTLGKVRIARTKEVADKTDLAVLVVAEKALLSGEDMQKEKEWMKAFQEKKTPILLLINQNTLSLEDGAKGQKYCENAFVDFCKMHHVPVCKMNAKTKEGMDAVKEQMVRLMPEYMTERMITGALVSKEDIVMLVMPQDIQAPKGRLILPQVQTIRELLDKKCVVMSVTTDQFESGLLALRQAPKLIITDSQEFDYVYQRKPKESMLTSFSVLFAAYKGDIAYYLEGARAIDSLNENAKVLIAECCTHAPLSEDIGRVKIPAILRKRFGQALTIDIVSGTDYPEDLSGYDLIIQCGACMFNRQYVLSRIERARNQQVPMTNYGITIAHLTGILDKIVTNSFV